MLVNPLAHPWVGGPDILYFGLVARRIAGMRPLGTGIGKRACQHSECQHQRNCPSANHVTLWVPILLLLWLLLLGVVVIQPLQVIINISIFAQRLPIRAPP